MVDQKHDQHDQRDAERDVDDVARRQHDRLAGHAPVELEEGDDRTGEGDGADGDAEAHLDQAWPWMSPDRADAEALGRIERGRRHHHGGKADEAVEGGDELRHRGHGDAARDDGADAAADGKADAGCRPKPPADGSASASVVTMAMAMPIMP